MTDDGCQDCLWQGELKKQSKKKRIESVFDPITKIKFLLFRAHFSLLYMPNIQLLPTGPFNRPTFSLVL
jgi:hypothetical protein